MFTFFSRSTFVLLSFYTILSIVIYASFKSSEEQSDSSKFEKLADDLAITSEFIKVDYYSQKNDKPYVYLNASSMVMDHTKNFLNLKSPFGNTYSNDSKPVNYKALSGKLDLNDKNLTLVGSVIVWDKLSEIKSEQLTYIQSKDLAEFIGNIKSYSVAEKSGDQVYIDSIKAIAWPNKKEGEYLGNVVGKIIRKKPYEPGINFKTDKMKLQLNNSYIELINNVYIKRDNAEAFAMRGEIFLENYNKKLKYYALYDDVKLIQHLPGKIPIDPKYPNGPKKPNDRRSFSEKLEGFAKEAKIVLTGYPKVIHEQDVVKGNKITFYENTEIVEVDDSTSSFIISK
ncbi:MAG: LPS export ABC transporter periplasmic protein LptC [Oligoflexia bacterium]|nr:LPS export ABC transporter periplasmic protein LptC [Oligoflexia bacterium]